MLQVRRGPLANLPGIAPANELLATDDEGHLYLGTATQPKPLRVYGKDYFYAEEDVLMTNTETTYAEYLVLDIVAPAGTYVLETGMLWQTNARTNFFARFNLDGTPLVPERVRGPNNTGDANFLVARVEQPLAGNHRLQIEFHAQAGFLFSNTAGIYFAYLRALRVG